MKQFLHNTWDIVLRTLASFGAVLSGAQSDLTLLLFFMAADYVLGLLRALFGKSSNSPHGGFSLRAALLGLVRKALMLMVVALAALLDGYAAAGGTLKAAAVWFYLCSEGVSVLENLSGFGIPVPVRLRHMLGQRSSG